MVRLNEDKEVVARIKEGLKAKGGYCPCKYKISEENKCMCKEFREQIADPEFEGYYKFNWVLEIPITNWENADLDKDISVIK